MSKDNMHGSMDLLLDTMCNTFGGVVFIALSLSLAFFVSQSQSSPEDNIAKVKKELEEQQQEFLDLQRKRSLLSKKLSSIKAFSANFTPTKTNLPEIVTRLEYKCKDIQREVEILKISLNELEQKNGKLENENQKMESAIPEKSRKMTEDLKRLSEEYKSQSFVIDELRQRLHQIPIKKFHFAHNERTSKTPYVLVVKDNKLFRLGANYLYSSREVKVKLDGNMLLLTCLDGTYLVAVESSDIHSLLHDFNKNSAFLWILVHPDSLDSFVSFRRLLRNASMPVHWYIDSGLILYLGHNVSYSASY